MMMVLSLSVFSVSSVSANSFSDVHNYKEEIQFLVERGIINGYMDGTFKPKNNITRLQTVTILLRELGIKDFTAPNPNFTDINENTKGYEMISKAVDMGIVSGKIAEDGTKYFDADGTLTRGQMAKILVNAFKLPLKEDVKFIDVNKENGFGQFISALASKRITTGYEDGTFKPNNKVTREHLVVFVSRAIDAKFIPEAPVKNLSYLPVISKKYHYSYRDLEYGYIGVGELSFYDKKYGWDVWSVVSSEGTSGQRYKETQDGLYFDIGAGFDYLILKYPAVLNAKWKSSNYEGEFEHTITKVNETLTIKAGTFSNVVVVEAANGSKYYLAPGIGIIKRDTKYEENWELTSISVAK